MSAADITRTLGGRWCGSYGLVRCPAHDDREPSLKIRDDARKSDGIDVHCFGGCSWKDVKAEWRRAGLIERFILAAVDGADHKRVEIKIAVAADQPKRTETALNLWRASIPLKGTVGQRYFVERRGLDVGLLELDHAIRWHAKIGAVVALMTDPVTNEPIGVHRTFLNSDGEKRDRKMLGKQGVVRLSPDEDVTNGLGITEGIEDGLAVLLSEWAPVWAATSAGGIARFPVLAGIESLTIFADNDAFGEQGSQDCEDRWIEAEREASILPPPGEPA